MLKRKKDDFNMMGLEGLNLYLDTIEALEDLEEFSIKNLCYLAKNLVNSIRRGRITINKVGDKSISMLWETTISRCFDILEECMGLISSKLSLNEITQSEKPGIISLMSDYVKCLNEEEERIEKKEKKEREESSQEIVLDGVPIDDIIDYFESIDTIV